MPFPSTVDCCGATRLSTLKAALGAVQNIGGADPANNPHGWDTWHQTLEKLARAAGHTFDDCCRLESRKTLMNLIGGITTGTTPNPGGGDVPAGALLDEDGNPILDENGDYIIIE